MQTAKRIFVLSPKCLYFFCLRALSVALLLNSRHHLEIFRTIILFATLFVGRTVREAQSSLLLLNSHYIHYLACFYNRFPRGRGVQCS